MVRVTPIKLQAGTKVLWFDPAEHNVTQGDHVIVSTERGCEFGTATADIMEVSDELVEQLKSPLKPVLRIADEADIERAAELAQKSEEALSTFKELAAETNEQMRPVMVEFLFDGDKAVFYFESEERIDFRDLVRKLASVFHVRVDMRQIGVRDGARMIGGLGHCGQELCCARMGGEFSPVSIRMAKEQNLSLNPQKISGCCGRLMCCLRYEYEAYKEVNARAPKVGAKIEIPDGIAKVTEVNVPLERVTLQLEDGHFIKVPLEEMEVVGEGKRPTRISQEVFDRYAAPDPLSMFESATSSLEVSSFTGEEKLATPKARSVKEEQPKEDTHRRPRRRRRSSASTDTDTTAASSTKDAKQDQSESKGKHAKKDHSSAPRKLRRSTSISSSREDAQSDASRSERSEKRKDDSREARTDRGRTPRNRAAGSDETNRGRGRNTGGEESSRTSAARQNAKRSQKQSQRGVDHAERGGRTERNNERGEHREKAAFASSSWTEVIWRA